jgi:hypothetical protein
VLRAAGAGILLTWVMLIPAPIFPLARGAGALRWLIIDVVAHTVDSSGLLDRLLPR